MADLPSCTGEAVPVVRLALAKERCARQKNIVTMNTPEAIAAFVTKHYGCKPQENFLGLYFNARNELLAVQEASLGALDATSVDPRVLFSGALLAGAAAMILVHNHPSGNPEPSQADLEVTRQLSIGARALSIRLLDHLVVARGGAFTSFTVRGIMPKESW